MFVEFIKIYLYEFLQNKYMLINIPYQKFMLQKVDIPSIFDSTHAI